MSCVNPIPAVKERDLATGKFAVDFNPRDWASRNAIFLPCGRCVGCRASQSMTWAIRCYHELLTTPGMTASFITLTYREPSPTELRPDDLRLFWMRARKRFGKLRYFACGERGDRTGRPHFHALVFGHDFLDGVVKHSTGVNYHPELDDCWSHGFVDVGSVEFASILYVAGYCGKKVGDPDTFSRMSRNPPLGYNYFLKHSDDLRRMGCCVIEGTEYPIPARYFDWDVSDDLQPVKDARADLFRGVVPDLRSLDARRITYQSNRSNRKEVL